MSAQIFTDAERPDLYERLDDLEDPWPEFIHHDETVIRLWPRLHGELPDFQLILHDADTDTVLGRGCTIPVAWDGRTDTLSGGVVDALEAGFSEGPDRNVLCALVAVVDPKQQGRGLSGHLIEGMARTAGRAGLDCLIAPVRPTWKDRHPLVPFEDYIAWTREDGLPFDPWIRLHTRLARYQRLGRRVGVVDRYALSAGRRLRRAGRARPRAVRGRGRPIRRAERLDAARAAPAGFRARVRGSRPMRFSYQLLPEQPVDELLDVIQLLDELGFWACYSADETYHKDMWSIFSAAAARRSAPYPRR